MLTATAKKQCRKLIKPNALNSKIAQYDNFVASLYEEHYSKR